jgi:hypothetical protein
MSDFSGFEQAFALPSVPPNVLEVRHAPPQRLPRSGERAFEVPLDEIEFRRVAAADELAAVQKLRAEIQLPGGAVADPGFVTREKKETGTGWSVHSNGGTASSAR